MHSTTSLCINFIVCIFILVQVYSGAKRGCKKTPLTEKSPRP